jgi:hypothetical protein
MPSQLLIVPACLLVLLLRHPLGLSLHWLVVESPLIVFPSFCLIVTAGQCMPLPPLLLPPPLIAMAVDVCPIPMPMHHFPVLTSRIPRLKIHNAVVEVESPTIAIALPLRCLSITSMMTKKQIPSMTQKINSTVFAIASGKHRSPPSPPFPLAVGRGGGGGMTKTAANCGSDGLYPDASVLPQDQPSHSSSPLRRSSIPPPLL